jgi:hypothetical protein
LFYLLGVAEQTFHKDLEVYKKLFPKLHPNFPGRLMTEDIETVLNEYEKGIQAEKEKTLPSKPTIAVENTKKEQ